MVLTLSRSTRIKIPIFLIGKGIKIGIARRIVEEIRYWVDNVKILIPIYEIH